MDNSFVINYSKSKRQKLNCLLNDFIREQKKILLFCLMVLIYNLPAIAQCNNFTFKRITEEFGLPSNAVRSIFQDRKGIFWFGIEGLGLCKYDGYTYKMYSNSPKDSTSIGSNFIDVICEDDNNNIWVGTNKGIYRLNRNNGTFNAYLSKYSKDTRNVAVLTILIDNSGCIWAGTNIGLFSYSKEKDCFFAAKSPIFEKKDALYVSSGTKDSKGNLWFASRLGIIVYKPISKQFEVIKSIYEIDNALTKSFTAIIADKNDNIWIATYNNLVCYNNSTKKYIFIHNVLNADNKRFFPTCLFCDEDNKIWLGGENMAIIDANTKSVISNKSNLKEIFKNSDIRTFFKDKSGLLWVGTKFQGIFIYNKTMSMFPLWNSKMGRAINHLNSDIILTVCEDNNRNIWIGTRDGGVNVLNRKTNSFRYLINDTKIANYLTQRFVSHIVKGDNNEIWIGTLFDLVKYDGDKGTINNYNVPGISYLCIDNGIIWVGTRIGFVKFSTKTKAIEKDTLFEKLFPNYRGKDVSVVFKDKDGLIWIGWQNDGLTCYDPRKGASRLYFHTNDSNSLSDNAVRSIYQDKKGRIWIGTKLQGLNLYNPLKNNFTNFTTNNGLSSNSIYQILEDSAGCFWLGTHNGISKFNPDTKEVETYNVDYGAQSSVFAQKANLACRNGELLMGGNNGFNLFRPSQIRKIYYDAPLIINSVKVYSNSIAIDIDRDTLFTFTYKQNYISFDFSLLDFSAPFKNQYKYKMINVDPDWIEAGNRHFVSYSELKPGKYTFRLRGSNSEGFWVKDERTIQILILPPWWQMWWFRLFLIIAILLCLFFIYNARISYLENRHKELEALVKKRTKELSKSNDEMQEQAARIEEQSEELRITNEQLLYRQETIEEQTHELKIFSNNISEANKLLLDRQKIIQDQTNQLQVTNKQLLILNSTKDKFFSIIAHDLRNPFSTIIGFSEVIMRNFGKLPEQKLLKYIDLINVSGQQGSNLLDNLLQWSLSQTERMEYKPTKINLIALAQDTFYLLEGALQRKGIASSIQMDDALEVFGDENMLKTVIRNLVSNSIKFTDTGGKITILAENYNGYSEIRISDTGIGISKENMEKLFRIESNITTKGTANEPGTGLGLVLCYEFIEKHNGKITVESEPGIGTTFIIKLPFGGV